MVRQVATCPLCGMWVHPNRFGVLHWPIRFFKRLMGGRWPGSKRGIIRFEPMDEPPRFREQLVWRVGELAINLGYRLEPIEPTRELIWTLAASQEPALGVLDIERNRTIATDIPGVRE